MLYMERKKTCYVCKFERIEFLTSGGLKIKRYVLVSSYETMPPFVIAFSPREVC